MAKKLVADKVELKTPFTKKEEPVKIIVQNGNLKVGDETPKESLKIFQNGNVGLGDTPLNNLDINGTFLPLGEPSVDNNIEEVLQDIIPISVEEFVLENVLNSVDTIQTIERGKLNLVKELILNSQNLEAISLLKTVQTAEYGKIEEIISKL